MVSFRKKEEVYLQRVAELDNITGVRDGQRQYHDTLRRQRLDEFMAGFQVGVWGVGVYIWRNLDGRDVGRVKQSNIVNNIGSSLIFAL